MFELMELSTGNLLGSYANEEDALRNVRETAEAFGPDAVATLALAEVDARSGTLLADGEALLKRAYGKSGGASTTGHPAVAA
jgi:hypothetical protein